MNPKATKSHQRARGTWLTFIALLFALGAASPASAQFTLDDSYAAWVGFTNTFIYVNSDGSQDFHEKEGGTSMNGFWETAELIEIADDAFWWSTNNYPGHNHIGYFNAVNALCAGFEDQNGANWSADLFNDDLNWATIAFERAYEITGNAKWLQAAETNFTVVWNRGKNGNGGLNK